MNVYVDSSVILRLILKQKEAFKDWKKIKILGTSELTWVESCRTLDRLRLERKLSDSGIATAHKDLKLIFERLIIFEVTRDILLSAASPHNTVIGTLDSIHLNTAILWKVELGSELFMLTHDKQLADASLARHLMVI